MSEPMKSQSQSPQNSYYITILCLCRLRTMNHRVLSRFLGLIREIKNNLVHIVWDTDADSKIQYVVHWVLGQFNQFVRVESQTEEWEPETTHCFHLFERLGEIYDVWNSFISNLFDLFPVRQEKFPYLPPLRKILSVYESVCSAE